MKKYTVKITAVLLFIALGITQAPLTSAEESSNTASLTIIHVNDRHGRMEADPFISQIVRDLKAEGKNTLLLDAGDALHGQIAANLTEGESMAELMNAVGYDAMVTGNHEFTYGIDRLLELSEMMDFPMLAANVKKDGKAVFKPYEIFDLNGIRAGVFGIATPETREASDPRIMEGLTFEDPAKTAALMVEALKNEDCGIIIALAHLGDNQVSLPENKSDVLAIPGVDVIIDGHSHTKLENGRTVSNTLIVQTGEYGQNIGVVEIAVRGGDVSKTARLIEVNEALAADGVITGKITELNKSVESMTKEVVGYTPFPLLGGRAEVRTDDTNLSNLITDSMRYATGADIAIISGGNIRAGIPSGDITMGHVLTVMPYSNLLVTMELEGSVILEALEHGVSLYPEHEGLFIQFSGLTVLFNPDSEPGGRIKSVMTADGSELEKERKYTVVTLEFLAAGGDGYTMLSDGKNIVYHGGDAEAFVDYLKSNPVIKDKAEDRIKTAGLSADTNETVSPKTGNSHNILYLPAVTVISLGGVIIYLRNKKA